MDNVKMEPIQAVDRAFAILETVARQNQITAAALASELHISKASLARLLYTMVQNGYLKVSKNGEYSITFKAYEVGVNAVSNLDRLSLINSTLVELNRSTGRIAQFSTIDHNQLLCIQSVSTGTPSFSTRTNVGSRSPVYCTSAGKAILAASSNETIIDMWNTFDIKAFTEHTITDLQTFLKEIASIRQTGYALDMEEGEYQLFCIGSVIRDHSGLPIGAISLSGNTLTKEEEQQLSTALISAAVRLSGLLGYI